MADKKLELNHLFKTMIEEGASDLHITVGSPPAFRVHGRIVRAKIAPLSPEDTQRLCLSVLDDQQLEKFKRDKEIDFAIGIRNVTRLRVNFFIQRGSIAAVFRRIPNEIPPLEKLGFNTHVQELVNKPNGLILLTGATGSGKSTTIASMINRINSKYRYHIVTLEDPIEYTHSHAMSIVNQREIGTDCESFSRGLRQVLREDPDVILVGEMRDRETTEEALRAAETGHLVFSTLHTNGAIASINRIVQMFGGDSQEYVRTVLSFTLEGIITQALCTRADGKGRVLVYEYLAMTPAVRNLIRENKLHQVSSLMQTGHEKYGMLSMNQSLAECVRTGKITIDEAIAHSHDVDDLLKMTAPFLNSRRAA